MINYKRRDGTHETANDVNGTAAESQTANVSLAAAGRGENQLISLSVAALLRPIFAASL